jgi:hypothetical protein
VGARSPGSDGVYFPRRLSGSHAVVMPEIVIPSEARNLLFLASWDIRNFASENASYEERRRAAALQSLVVRGWRWIGIRKMWRR